MLKEANGMAVPKFDVFLPEFPAISAEKQKELKSTVTGELFSFHAFRMMGRNDLAEHCQKRVMDALVELIEAGAL
ncbi:hypothetical protein [Bombella apis]|uniref:hypothetical protein n=1 Tax=Bombella apis TaxID=1785988 RepID=UPI0012BA36E3|nr:hypothetical protein [Bombella apis]MPW00426.1 hypothetical protein [Bombella apis]